MKFANVDGCRREAAPGLSGECPVCSEPTIAKCGDSRAWHWAHKRTRVCDHWWENETQWHRAWKNVFSETWQEVVHSSADGEKHIADVKAIAYPVLRHRIILTYEAEAENVTSDEVIKEILNHVDVTQPAGLL